MLGIAQSVGFSCVLTVRTTKTKNTHLDNTTYGRTRACYDRRYTNRTLYDAATGPSRGQLPASCTFYIQCPDQRATIQWLRLTAAVRTRLINPRLPPPRRLMARTHARTFRAFQPHPAGAESPQQRSMSRCIWLVSLVRGHPNPGDSSLWANCLCSGRAPRGRTARDEDAVVRAFAER